MPGYTENRIVIFGDYEQIFELTNKIEVWPKLFTEYKDAQVISQKDNEIKFRLTTFAEGQRPERSWVSRRKLFKSEGYAEAERLDPLFPFKYMKIRWEYERLPNNIGVIMTWIQEFDVADDCKFSVTEMESFLNHNTHKQIKSVKNNVEGWGQA